MILRNRHSKRTVAAVGLTMLATSVVGCTRGVVVTDGTVARGYPYETPIVRAIDVQVFRKKTTIELVNYTAHSYADFDLWLNERFVRHVERLEAGETLQLSLFEFVDEHGEGLNAGGLLASERPDPIVKAEIETTEGLIGLVAIPDPDTP